MTVVLLVGGQICLQYGGLWIPSSFSSSSGLSSSRIVNFSRFPLSSQNGTLPGTYEDGDYIASNGFTTVTNESSTSRFYFPNNNTVEITSKNSTILEYHFNFGVENSDISLDIDTLETISIELEKKATLDDFAPIHLPYDEDFPISWSFGTFIHVTIPNLPYPDSAYDESSLRLSLENFLFLNPALKVSDIYPVVWNPDKNDWDLLTISNRDNIIEIPFAHNSGEISENNTQKTLIFTLFNRITLTPAVSDGPSVSFPFFPVIIGLAFLIVSTLALSSEHYRTLIVRTINPNHGMHRLNFGEIFENENRMKIINAVLDEPGIHFNELKRQCNVQTGQLRWHINLLESYGILQMHKIGQYNAYYPTISENPISAADLPIIKSKSTLNILKMIEDVPGITASRIAKILGLGRNTVKYHVDKLLEKQLISITKEGRQLKLSRISELPTP
ncbi:MAG: winged helix-turn-helix transcriptional regulator [Promethearchaeota archaeon]